MREAGIRGAGRRLASAWADRLEAWLNNIGLKKKLALLYIVCVLLPLVLTDSIILGVIVSADRKADRKEMQNAAEAIRYSLKNTLDSAADLATNIYSNRYINEFIGGSYETPLEYYNAYLAVMEDSLLETVIGQNGRLVIYADNPDIVNGGYFARLESVTDSDWYQSFLGRGQEIAALAWYDARSGGAGNTRQKRLSIVRRMDYYEKGRSSDVLFLDLDYGAVSRSLTNAGYSSTVYVCENDRILFSNDGRGGVSTAFESIAAQTKEAAGVHGRMTVYGDTWDIYVMKPSAGTAEVLARNLPLIAFLVLVNVGLPFLLMVGINRSFTRRLQLLDEAFEKQADDSLPFLPQTEGRDEIGRLMHSYNAMADRMNGLIRTVYKERLKEQEMDIARQKAELLALHSQINPHFLFNALESIRMHSVLKKEYETADMVEKLALMQRQNAEWSRDMVRVEEEAGFVEAYLELQRYRFGDRLSYRIETDRECRDYLIPRLTLVTFAENACVHGMENKASRGWVFVQSRIRGKSLELEVEDTGSGMSAAQVYELQDKMNRAGIGQLREKGRVGILNACLRLRMATKDRVSFSLESEEGAGTIVTVRIPLGALEKERTVQEGR
ncbi:MAG: histidine kinase [Eubacteriales bacterium]|nr:histidine kinase [Eubacteriales bacterium]